ncbi:MAG TPA: hypothetical protein VE344_08590 [Methylomirabilota bacterium]|nr:hypothetical protein [Methylomirabilota bacterium]
MKKILVVSALVIGAVAVHADQPMNPAPMESAPFQASLTPDISVHPKTTEIRGFAINVWGENPQSGLSLGIVNGSTGESRGLSWAVFNYDDSYTGVQWGLANYSKQSFKGWQGGIFFLPCFANVSDGTFTGLQEGMVNVSENFTGLQVGIVNYSKNLHGVQIGLANIAMNNGWFDQMPDKFAKGFPLFNWSF